MSKTRKTRKAGTLSPLLRTIEQKLKEGRYGPTAKSITKQEALKILQGHFRTRLNLTIPAAKITATMILDKIYKKILQEKKLPRSNKKHRPTLRRFKSATRVKFPRTRRRQRKRTV